MPAECFGFFAVAVRVVAVAYAGSALVVVAQSSVAGCAGLASVAADVAVVVVVVEHDLIAGCVAAVVHVAAADYAAPGRDLIAADYAAAVERAAPAALPARARPAALRCDLAFRPVARRGQQCQILLTMTEQRLR